MRRAQGKYMEEVNSLHRRLKHAKKEQKEEAGQYEKQLRKMKQELKGREKMWSEAKKNFLEEVVQMSTHL